MADKDLEERVRSIELRLAYLTGAAVVGLAAILSYMGLTSWQTIPNEVKREVGERVGNEALEKITLAETAADKIIGAEQLLSSIPFIQAGVVSMSSAESRALQSGDEERIYEEAINFSQPFEAAPTVVLGITSLDSSPGGSQATRISVSATQISPNGFTVKFRTWNTNRVYSAAVSYVAVGRSARKVLAAQPRPQPDGDHAPHSPADRLNPANQVPPK